MGGGHWCAFLGADDGASGDAVGSAGDGADCGADDSGDAGADDRGPCSGDLGGVGLGGMGAKKRDVSSPGTGSWVVGMTEVEVGCGGRVRLR
ncbi:hypothetical protein GCM10010428_55900 [Actinosynnema pretiosum subsp. pretiosum]